MPTKLPRDRGEEASDRPNIQDLASSVRFAPASGRLWLGDKRMVMLHAEAFAELRRGLIESVGLEAARELFMRSGFQQGFADAELIRKRHPDASAKDLLAKGPLLHAIQGFVGHTPIHAYEWDSETGRFFMDASWTESIEAESQVATYGVGQTSSCWMASGYASGYATLLYGRPLLYREVECRALGHARCRVVGKPLVEWPDAGGERRYFQMEPAKEPAVPDFKAVPGLDLVGGSVGFNAVVQMVRRVAPSNVPILFQGESGVGKEVFARAAHLLSQRAGKPFVAVNCAAIPESLVEAELFGVEKGAFTGAVESREGRFGRAAGGTLFLDEIGTLTLAAQAKLLRVLQEGTFERVGGRSTSASDVRIIAATNVDLREEVAARRFRDDLFYRLNAFPIEILPLRERRSDIPMLLDHFLVQLQTKHGKSLKGYTEQAFAALLDYGWPGNVRELENIVERGVILAPEGGAINVHHLFTFGERVKDPSWSPRVDGDTAAVSGKPAIGDPTPVDLQRLQASVLAGDRSLGEAMQDIEKVLVESAVAAAQGNLSAAARSLGMTRAQLAYRLQRYAQPAAGGQGD